MTKDVIGVHQLRDYSDLALPGEDTAQDHYTRTN